MAHALDFYNGKCKNIHGHSYQIDVTIIGVPEVNKVHHNGMVMDFGDLKTIVNAHIISKFDHSLVLAHDSDKRNYAGITNEKIVILENQPTCENLVIFMADQIKNNLPKGVSLFSIKLRETATSFAEWFGEDNV